MSRCRLVNQNGPQPITVTEVRHYCDLEGVIDEEDRRELLFHIMNLDTEWLRHKYADIEREHEKRKKEATKKANSRGRR